MDMTVCGVLGKICTIFQKKNLIKLQFVILISLNTKKKVINLYEVFQFSSLHFFNFFYNLIS